MKSHALLVLSLGVFSPALTPAVRAADKDVEAVAAAIDSRIAAAWDKDVKPAALADDAEFFRRIHLDLAGRIPSVTEIRDFLDDERPNKRRLWVDRILQADPDDASYRDAYVTHFTNVWRGWLLAQTNQGARFRQPALEAWLRQRLKRNVGYDRLVRELLTQPIAGNQGNREDGSAAVFYQANEFKPENLAGSASRLFLGVKLECAQCHDHPFDKWKRKQFWEYAAFFASIQGGPGRPGRPGSPMAKAPTEKRTIKYKQGTKDIEVEARFLDGKVPAWKDNVAVRATLADWMTSPANPFFARNAVNRMWAHFFGIGIIDPVDEPGDDHPPSHPELLDQLTKDFTDHKFDLKFVIRAITASKTYQLSSATATEPTPEEARLFTHMAVRGLSPEQLFDSLSQATGDSQQLNRRFAEQRQRILSRFANPSDKPTEFQTSILQALSLMNGEYMEESTKLDPSLLAQKGVEALQKRSGAALSAIADAPFFDTKGRIEALYLSALSRKPRPAELEKLVKYVDKGGPSGNSKRALADVFWALLNSPEFFLNH